VIPRYPAAPPRPAEPQLDLVRPEVEGLPTWAIVASLVVTLAVVVSLLAALVA
jgi:hypothetical protein